jgi:hypothetical protein
LGKEANGSCKAAERGGWDQRRTVERAETMEIMGTVYRGKPDQSSALDLHQDVDGCVDVSCGHVNGGHDALVARSLEGVQTCPVSRQVDRLKDVDIDRRAGAKNQCRVARLAPQPASTSIPST